MRKYLVKVKTIKHVLHILLLLLSLSLTEEYFKKISAIFNFNVELHKKIILVSCDFIKYSLHFSSVLDVRKISFEEQTFSELK